MHASNTNSGMPRFAIYLLSGLVVFGLGLFLIGAGEPPRIWANLLAGSFGMLGLGLGAAVWLALFCVTGARWSEILQPVVQMLTLLLPTGAIGVLVVLIAAPSLYPWRREAGSDFQAIWLSGPFFMARSFIYLASWLGSVFLLVRACRRNDPGRVRVAAMFLVIFGITCWLASVDWIMSLEPKWSSTIFGVYQFAGMFLGALAAITIFAIWAEQRGALGGRLTPRQLCDLGTLLFSFSSFWVYIWFSQYMLIWFANIPEEADYFVLRQQDRWEPFFVGVVALNWGIPFVVLLFQRMKESRAALLAMAAIILFGRWLDIYVMVLPTLPGSAFVIGDVGVFLAMIGLAALIVGQPLLVEASPTRP